MNGLDTLTRSYLLPFVRGAPFSSLPFVRGGEVGEGGVEASRGGASRLPPGGGEGVVEDHEDVDCVLVEGPATAPGKPPHVRAQHATGPDAANCRDSQPSGRPER